ncbi:VOC family protein [Lachnospiraceae bacterium OttesenSCG-928-E19]|nr:VOC family protein [Lachnospiraceae bacterium OttesenSCG-928-E19]
MKSSGTLIAVSDLERSKKFYQEVLNLKLVEDVGARVVMTGGIVLQTLESWKEIIHKSAEEIVLENNAVEIRLETDDMDVFVKGLAIRNDVEYVHPIQEYRSGMRLVRIYDPDRYIISIGENTMTLVRKLLEKGYNIAEVAKRMGVSKEYVINCLQHF